MAYLRARTPAPRSTLPQNVSSPFAGRPFQPTVAPAEKPPLAEESRAEVRPTLDFTKVPVHSAAPPTLPRGGAFSPVLPVGRRPTPAVSAGDCVQLRREGLHEPSDEQVVSAVAEGVRTPAVALPYLDRIQASFGRYPDGHVKAHVGAGAAQASQAMGARAFASGDHVVFDGAPNLRTAAHEAALRRAAVLSAPGSPYPDFLRIQVQPKRGSVNPSPPSREPLPQLSAAVTPGSSVSELTLQTKGDGSGSREDASAAQRPNKTLPHDPEEDEAERLQLKSHAGAAGSDREKPEEPPNRTGLPGNLKAGIESLPGLSLADIKVHYNSSQPAQLSALAYAQGSDIYVAPGQERHLPHEAWHIVQQAEGRVKPTRPIKLGVPINDDERLEHEADVMGAKALATAPHLHGTAGATAEPAQQSAAPGTPAAQMKYELCKPQDVKFTSDHRALIVEAKNISGSTLDPAANSPSVSPFGWKELKAAGHTLANKSGTNSHYNAVRAHLMNGRLGGPGDDTKNLAPVPAKVNSLMSAGPETEAKNLVDAGQTIWLRTTVSYYSQSTTATDFTAVVPNQISMEWGPMGGTGQAWSTAIELPVAPLQGAEAQEYQNWDSAKTTELVAKLQNQTNQVRAQAFGLVPPGDLKFAILNAYPQVFLSMERAAKGQVLGALTEPNRLSLLGTIGGLTSPDQLVAEGVLPLAAAGKSMEAQNLFKLLPDDKQRAALISWKKELLKDLGQIGNAWSKKDYTIFLYNEPVDRAYLVNGMSEAELDDFLGNRPENARMAILDGWAAFFSGNNADKVKAVNENVKIKQGYRLEYARWTQKNVDSDQYNINRGKRDKKKPFWQTK